MCRLNHRVSYFKVYLVCRCGTEEYFLFFFPFELAESVLSVTEEQGCLKF